MKRILILGGTGFVGRILSENLRDSGYPVTLFNRGKRNPSLFPEFNKIQGDRNTADIFKIASIEWDVIIDFSGFFPDNMEIVASFLKGTASRYIFISTASVYDLESAASDSLKYPILENYKLLSCTSEQRVDKHPFNYYGNKKAECERVLLQADWLDTIIFRPALIYGRYDPTDRFYYWLYRAKTQDKIVIPDEGKTMITNTYSEDFAAVLKASIEIDKHQPVYNAVTHPALSLKDIVLKMAGFFKKEPELMSSSPEFLQANDVGEWVGIPLWIKDFSFVLDNKRMLNDFKIKYHSFEESLETTIKYYDSLTWEEGKDGITVAREKELINLLKSGSRS